MNKKNKKKAAATGAPNENSENPSELAGAKFDENYYDLDDDFIDDGDIEMIDQDDDQMMHDLYDTSKYQSAAQSELPEVDREEGGNSSDENGFDEQSHDSDKERQDRRYQKILQNFRVLMPEEVEEMLAEDARKEEQRKNDKLKRDQPQQMLLTGMLQPAGASSSSALTTN